MPLRRVALLFDVIVPDPNVALHPAKLIAEVENLPSPRRDRLRAKAVPSVMRRFSERVLSLSPLKLGSGSGRRGVARQYTPRSSKASAMVRRSALVPTQRLPRVPPEEAIHYPSPIGARSRSRVLPPRRQVERQPPSAHRRPLPGHVPPAVRLAGPQRLEPLHPPIQLRPQLHRMTAGQQRRPKHAHPHHPPLAPSLLPRPVHFGARTQIPAPPRPPALCC